MKVSEGWQVYSLLNHGIEESKHVVPVNDLRRHALSANCWCNPKQDDENMSLYAHNAMDDRESYEQGRPLQ